jgi:hypothetical protein
MLEHQTVTQTKVTAQLTKSNFARKINPLLGRLFLKDFDKIIEKD